MRGDNLPQSPLWGKRYVSTSEKMKQFRIEFNERGLSAWSVEEWTIRARLYLFSCLSAFYALLDKDFERLSPLRSDRRVLIQPTLLECKS